MKANRHTISILQPSYLPWLGFFEQMARVDLFVFYDDAQYTKNDWRNRNRVKTPHGVRWLTVPVLTSGHFGGAINEVKIDNSKDWKRQHLGTLEFAYRSAPFFDLYFPRLAEIVRGAGDSLCEFNVSLIEYLASAFGAAAKTLRASEMGVSQLGKNERLVEICRRLGATELYEGAAGRGYIDEALFAAAGTTVTFQDYRHPVYSQLHGDFTGHLSAVDLLFNCGPESLKILQNRLIVIPRL